MAGLAPVFCDVSPETLLMEPGYADAAMEDGVRVLLTVHLYGRACDMDAIVAYAKERDLRVVEDCAQAHGAAWSGRSCGTFGDAAAFSFYPTKNLGALGDGGAVATMSGSIAGNVRALRTYGSASPPDGSFRVWGINSRLDELQAAFLRVMLLHLDDWNAARARIASIYSEELASMPLVLPASAPEGGHCWHLYVVRHPERDALQRHLESRGIATIPHYPRPLHEQRQYYPAGLPAGTVPNADRACAEVLSLPCYPTLSESSAGEVCRAIREFFE